MFDIDFDFDLYELKAGKRINRILKENGINTYINLKNLSIEKILKMDGFGRSSLEDLKKCFDNYFNEENTFNFSSYKDGIIVIKNNGESLDMISKLKTKNEFLTNNLQDIQKELQHWKNRVANSNHDLKKALKVSGDLNTHLRKKVSELEQEINALKR